MLEKKKVIDLIVVDGKIFAILSYLSLFCIVPLLFKKENSFVLEHGKQGLVIFIAETIVFVLHILLGVWFLKVGIFILGVCSIAGMIAVVEGRLVEIPFISRLAKSIIL